MAVPGGDDSEGRSPRRRVGRLLLLAAAITTANAALHGATREVGDPDGWWVAAAGRRMLQTGAVPRYNGWSFTAPDHPWVMHEWALSPLYAWGAEAGPVFFSALSLLLALVLIGLVFAGSGTRDRRVGPQLLATAAYAGLFGLASAFSRPTVAALVFAGAMAALASRARVGWRWVALALVVQLLWTNAHGSFPLGCLLLLWSALAFPEDRRRRLVAVAGAALVTFLNPYGAELHQLVLAYATGGDGGLGWARETLVEFQPLWAGGLAFVHPSERVGLVALAVLALHHMARPSFTPRREAFARGGLSIGLLLLASWQARHSTLAGLVATIVLAPAFGALWQRPVAIGRRKAAALTFGPALILGLIGLGLAGGRPSAKTGGAELLALTRSIADGAHVFAPFHQAGRVVWETERRGVRVFYDSRNDCYPGAVARDGWAVEHGDLEPLARWGTGWAIARAGTPLDDALARSGDWETVKTVVGGRLFVRR